MSTGASPSRHAEPEPERDGRVLRAARTRQLVVEAFLDLLVDGEPQPTAQQVADRSGVSMRSIFRLFDDVEALHGAAISTQIGRVADLIIRIGPDGPLEVRVRAVVDSRAKLFEAISPVRRMAVRLAPKSQTIGADLDMANEFFRAQVAEVFDNELSVLAVEGRRDVLEALDLATSWEIWERLRGIQGMPERRARRIVADLIHRVLVDGR